MIRILRILEYTYESNERAEQDMKHWQIPAVGSRRHGDMTIRSAIITDLNFQPIEENTNDVPASSVPTTHTTVPRTTRTSGEIHD